MAGIAGIARSSKTHAVNLMLDKIAHRGKAGKKIMELDGATLGAVWPRLQAAAFGVDEKVVKDAAADGRLAAVQVLNGKPFLLRGLFGVAPLYFGRTDTGTLCLASEVKALLTLTRDVNLLPPGHSYDGEVLTRHFQLKPQPPASNSATEAAGILRGKLEDAVRKCVQSPVMGCWLSGGLDSSAMVALARPMVKDLHSFAVGLRDAPDLEYAREVAAFATCTHHELVVTMPEMLAALPKVVYHLESFDALLVRSSITNYLVAKLASDYVEEVLSGEGGDELFAGYAYLKALDQGRLADELVDITTRLHNTALQRVDRCAAAHGLVAYVPFMSHEVVDYALRIPVAFKIRNGVEKWILRRALDGLLPPRVLTRPKVKFWEGAGVGELLAEHAEKTVSDNDFHRERQLPNGWTLNSKEELLYYRLFREHFGQVVDLTWMGRTKGVPGAQA
jgi:asparagine synthase (glutamine-hydrolysing)